MSDKPAPPRPPWYQPNRKQLSIQAHVYERVQLLAQALSDRLGRKITLTELIDRATAALAEQYAQGNWLSPAERGLSLNVNVTEIVHENPDTADQETTP